MTSELACWSQTPFAVLLSTWINTLGYSELRGSLLWSVHEAILQFDNPYITLQRGCKMHSNQSSQHVVVLRRGQFYYFDVLDSSNRPLMTEREILRNLQAIVTDADKTPVTDVARSAIGVLSTENRKTWSQLRATLQNDRHNASCLHIVDDALFVVCLDDARPDNLAELCSNFLCGTYELNGGKQVGTCTNRWYDKVSSHG